MTSNNRRVVTFSSTSASVVTPPKPATSPTGETNNVLCICERSNAKVLCKACGFLLENGRVRTPCLVHPQIFYLLDMETCPKCNNSSALIEVHPFNFHRDYKDLPSPSSKPMKFEPDDPPGDAPDERKNFFHRSRQVVELPVLGSLSTNTAKNRQSKKSSTYSVDVSQNQPIKVFQNQPVDIKDTKLYVSKVPRTITYDQLQEPMFSPFGRTLEKKVIRNELNGMASGNAFSRYDKEEHARNAIDSRTIPMGGTNDTRVKTPMNQCIQKEMYNAGITDWKEGFQKYLSQKQSVAMKDTKVYVSKLPRTITHDQLEQIFSPFGRIEEKKILKSRFDGMASGVAFVRYEKKDNARNAMNALDGKSPMGCTDPIGVKIAMKKDK